MVRDSLTLPECSATGVAVVGAGLVLQAVLMVAAAVRVLLRRAAATSGTAEPGTSPFRLALEDAMVTRPRHDGGTATFRSSD